MQAEDQGDKMAKAKRKASTDAAGGVAKKPRPAGGGGADSAAGGMKKPGVVLDETALLVQVETKLSKKEYINQRVGMASGKRVGDAIGMLVPNTKGGLSVSALSFSEPPIVPSHALFGLSSVP